jgi:hypothetical protein
MCRMIGIGLSADSSTEKDAEKGPQLCSRLDKILNVAQGLRLRFSLALYLGLDEEA